VSARLEKLKRRAARAELGISKRAAREQEAFEAETAVRKTSRRNSRSFVATVDAARSPSRG
jgi:hypothetical protein